MFGKLLKYEFKAVGKWYLGLYAAAGLLSVIIGLWFQNITSRSRNDALSDFEQGRQAAVMVKENMEAIFFAAIMIGFALIIAGLFLSTFFLIVNRFRKNVYGRQGYLTMTLPVTNHQIILSKLTAGCVWSILSGLTTILCLLLIFFIGFSPLADVQMNELWASLDQAFLQLLGNHYMLTYVFSFIVGAVHSVLLIYFAISLGQLFKDYRTLLAIVFYVGISFVESIASLILASSLGGYNQVAPLSTYSILGIVFSILLACGYYFGTHYIMTKKLNLQ